MLHLKAEFKMLLTLESTFRVHENSYQYDTVAEHYTHVSSIPLLQSLYILSLRPPHCEV